MTIRTLTVAALGLLALGLGSCAKEATGHRVIVLGIDGMDYRMARDLMDRGALPNLKALAEEGGFSPLGSSIPPQSPVAWSNFITGMNPGGHGVYDFLHKEWKQGADGTWSLALADSISGVEDVGTTLRMFGYAIPLTGGDAFNKRRGTPFWSVLEQHDVPATVFRMPANYPPTATDQQTLSGMGTPDMQGGYGVYFLYTDDPLALSDEIETGKVRTVSVYNHTVRDFLIGPPNALIDVESGQLPPESRTPFRLDIDPEQPIARILIGDEDADGAQSIVLKQGEWSEFVEVDFELLPYVVTLTGAVRFHLQEVRPTLRLFVEPINMSPRSPMLDISTPADWAADLAETHGLYETKGMPENTKALEEGAIDDDEFREHSLLVYEKTKEMLYDLVDRQQAGVLFHYFSSIDLDSHMLWRNMDPQHPNHKADVSEVNRGFIEWLYRDIDQVVGRVRAQLRDGDALIVMSDHGFSPYYRTFHLNQWLLDKGYLQLKPEYANLDALDPAKRDQLLKQREGLLAAVDWSETKAYNLGFQSIYLNVRGRDPMGIVPDYDVDRLVDEISTRLLNERDPKDGASIVATVYKGREVFTGEAAAEAPEIVVGFARHYRNSDASTQGAVPEVLIEDNLDAWSGCHLMAAEEVPGVLFTNRKIGLNDPKLYDLTVTLLSEYGIDQPASMVGQPIWQR